MQLAVGRRLGLLGSPSFGLVAIIAIGVAIYLSGAGTWQLWVFLLMPDIALLAGIGGSGLARGQLKPDAVPFYNALHRFVVPIAMALLALLALHGPAQQAWLAGALGWIAHIAADNALGFGLRDAEGFQRRR